MREVYDSDLKPLLRRLEVIEHILGKPELEQALSEIVAKETKACADGDHAWRQIDYDLQGGKWGRDRCARCGEEKTWSV